ncbi:MAG: SpoIIE family protein phosphatase, partial [Bacteroidia bacterium]|nr:SpoIIE family protein phosphatase [Bacteroidia bacterium]
EEEIRKQKEHIEEIHKDLTDSVNYAKRLQSSALPDRKLLYEHFNESFIVFKPKDVVSGDFYWFVKVLDSFVVTVADCTGHGVPGAFMSMISMTLLKEIVINEYITQPDVILRKLRKEIIIAFKQTGASGEPKDGMDISLCSINLKTLEMQWSGANNPLYIIQTVASQPFELKEIKPDKMPVAYYEKMDKFTLHELKLNKGDIIYLASDGYQDQFGGRNGKKFLSKRFKELLLKTCPDMSQQVKSMKEQEEILDKTIESWMHGYETKYEQTDDITVMGIKI